MHLTREGQDLFTGNCKTLLRSMKESLNKWRVHAPGLGNTIFSSWQLFPNLLVFKLNATLIKISAGLIKIGIDKPVLIIIWKFKRLRTDQTVLKNIKQNWRLVCYLLLKHTVRSL